MPRTVTLIFFLLLFDLIYAQQGNTVIKGIVTDTSGYPVSLVNIGIKGLPYGTYTGEDGSYLLSFTADNNDHILVVSSISYKSREIRFTATPDTLVLNIRLETDITELQDVTVREFTYREAPSLKNIPMRDIMLIPSVSGNIEKMLISLPGVNSGNELSNQYTVRGGNYDENLVYVNDVEIYRPVLIKTGRQEGLSFLNPDLIRSVMFSPGGFNASYGDRMSSVLDITYKNPLDFKGSVNMGLLTNSAHIEGSTVNKKLSYLAGVRFKTNRFLLQTLDTKGNYKPSFYDLQSLLKYRLSEKTSISLLGSYNSNTYTFTPYSRSSSFGNYLEAYQLFVLYQGKETDSYNSLNIALSLNTESGSGLTNKFILHYYNSTESENYDIRGSYSLNMTDKNTGSENLGDSIMNVGIGSWLKHARNLLQFDIFTFRYKGRWEYSDNILNWGIKLSHELTNDRLREWEKTDSAGYSIPYSPEGLLLGNVIISDTILPGKRVEAYLIDSYTLNIADHRLIFSGGARLSYWSFSGELLFSPRLSLSWRPPSGKIQAYISGGTYYQTPFYREMRYPSGEINISVRAQKSVHTVIGSVYDFSFGTTPFHLSAELYYKDLSNIIPYKYDNVRIIYSAENSARGFVRGFDLKINGEFVKNAESWISLSLMDARHNIDGDDYGFFPAPSDTRFSVNLFFQDYFPSNPEYRAHINLHYSTGIPVSSPFSDRYDSYNRMPSYRRVDLGFTRVIKSRSSTVNNSFLKLFDEVIAGFEVFNLLDIRNTISYNWLTTVNNLSGESRQYAVPNYLTGRSLNLRLLISF